MVFAVTDGTFVSPLSNIAGWAWKSSCLPATPGGGELAPPVAYKRSEEGKKSTERGEERGSNQAITF